MAFLLWQLQPRGWQPVPEVEQSPLVVQEESLSLLEQLSVLILLAPWPLP